MSIRYVAYTWLGKRVEGVLETDSEEKVYQTLEQDQLIPYRLTLVRPRRSLVELTPSLFRPKDQAIINFTRGLASLLRAGISLRAALNALQAQTRNLGLKEALRQIIRTIEAGQSFSEACSRHPTVFPGFYVRLLRVAEAIGGTSTVLERLAQTLERHKTVKGRVKSALTYPAISLGIAMIAAFVLITYSLPALLGMLEEFGGELPPTTALLVLISGFLQTYGAYMIGSMVAVIAASWAYSRTPGGAMMRDRLLLKVPIVATVLRSSNMFSLTSTLSTVISGGVPLLQALQLAREGLGNAVMRRELEAVARDTNTGMALSQAFHRQRVFPPLLAQGIATGEVAGNLGEVLQNLADYYEKETERAVTGFTELLQPAIILIVAVIVGFVAVAIVSGIYSTLGAIS
jgi:type IV pilus assembly protein PilC